MKKHPKKTAKGRLSKRDWLAQAMNVLSSEGDAELRIAPLCAKLGVTKGSFYAHFEDRQDFVRQILQYWVDGFTGEVIAAMDEFQDQPAKARLLALMQIVQENSASRHDIPLRAWATHDAVVAKEVQKVFRMRFDYVRQIFYDIGFRDAELEARTRAFVLYHSHAEHNRWPWLKVDANTELELIHKLFIRK